MFSALYSNFINLIRNMSNSTFVTIIIFAGLLEILLLRNFIKNNISDKDKIFSISSVIFFIIIGIFITYITGIRY